MAFKHCRFKWYIWRFFTWAIWIDCFLASLANDKTLPHFSQFSFSIQPSDIIVHKGKSATLPCSAVYPSKIPDIQWMKDGEYLRLHGDTRRSRMLNGSLHFNKVLHDKSSQPDVGAYQCVASITGLGSIISHKAKLQVAHIAKVFKVVPQTQSVPLGDTAMFQCDIDSLPKASYSWFKDGRSLSTSNNIKVYSGGVVEVSPVLPSDFGSYHCQASNTDKVRTSPQAQLRQLKKSVASKPNIILSPRDTRAVEGESVILYCGADGRDDQGKLPVIAWLKDGISIKFHNASEAPSRLQRIGNGSLFISAVKEEDSGIYTCRAMNNDDSVDADATLSVLVPPKFIERPTNTFAHEKNDVLFKCDIYGNPAPNISWWRNGDIIISSHYFQIVDGHHLRISGLVHNDQGVYQCFGENEVGDIQSSAQLKIVQPDVPLPTTPSQMVKTFHAAYLTGNSEYLPREPINLMAAFVSSRFVALSWEPPDDTGPSEVLAYSVYWKEKGSERERVLNITSEEANIQHLKPDTQYEFRVRTYNKYGASTDLASLVVKTDPEVSVPSPPKNLIAYAISSKAIKVEWEEPVDPKGTIQNYSLFYYGAGEESEHETRINGLSQILNKLKSYREYSFRVVAHNHNGPGESSPEVIARTNSDVPSAPPQNVTLEVSSSTSIIVHWSPPPEDRRNGVITGYRIRYKKRGGKQKGVTIPTAGDRGVYALIGLRKNTEYQVRIQATTINGTGPASHWHYATTYEHDLYENDVPPPPEKIVARPQSNSIIVSWTPPDPKSKILVKGYELGYGKGIPDVYQVTLDSQKYYYKIESLQPNSEYVITIKAFNSKGSGQPKYASATTGEKTTPEPATPMMPPIGLKSIVLSDSTIVVTWTDNSLGGSRKITDNRYYTIKYKAIPNRNNRFKYVNSTELNAHIDELRPNTQYEFAVKVIKGRRQSTWSMSIHNVTQEAAPGTQPRDLTTIPVEGNPLAVRLTWQPPQKPNGLITGYLVFYTTNDQRDYKDWVLEGVLGDKLSRIITGLTSDTKYFFKVQARNSKGYGPMSDTVTYRTPIVPPDFDPAAADKNTRYNYDDFIVNKKNGEEDGDGEKKKEDKGISTNVLIIIIACVLGTTFIIVIGVVVGILLCRRRESNFVQRRGYKPPALAKPDTPKGQPPDLWIHHDNLELKNIDKSDRSESMASVPGTRRGSHPDSKSVIDESGMDTAERRRNSFASDVNYHSGSEDRLDRERDYDRERERYYTTHIPQQQTRNIIRPKPLTIPPDTAPPREPIATVTALPNGHMLQSDQGPIPMRPVYPRTQYNMQYSAPPRVNASDITHAGSVSSVKLPILEEDDPMSNLNDTFEESFSSRVGYGIQSPSSPSSEHQPYSTNSLEHKKCVATSPMDGSKGFLTRPFQPIRGFGVSGGQSNPTSTSTPKLPAKQIVKPQQSATAYRRPAAPVSSAPVKPRTMPLFAPKAPENKKKSQEDPDIKKSHSTEELTAEMANLEGLMKDLNAITQQEFEC